jgi:hypothetical protein
VARGTNTQFIPAPGPELIGTQPTPDIPDDRRTCAECGWLIGEQCEAARRGLMGDLPVSRYYRPHPTIKRRCKFFRERVKGK